MFFCSYQCRFSQALSLAEEHSGDRKFAGLFVDVGERYLNYLLESAPTARKRFRARRRKQLVENREQRRLGVLSDSKIQLSTGERESDFIDPAVVAAELCPRIFENNATLWEKWCYQFANLGELAVRMICFPLIWLFVSLPLVSDLQNFRVEIRIFSQNI